MPKEEKVKKPHKKEKVEVPPDAFDEPVGTKVLISELDEKDVEKPIKSKKEDGILASDVPAVSEKENELMQDEVKVSNLTDKDAEFVSEEGLEEDEKYLEESEEAEENKIGEKKEISFYEKVLGEKPPVINDDEDAEEQKESLNRSLFFLGGVVFILTIIVASSIGYLILNARQVKNQEPVVDQQIPTPTVSPTPIEIDRESITFEVLNGSGQQGGMARKTAEAIKKLGYTADEVGNADSSNYSGITVGFSGDLTDSEKEIILDDLKKELLRVEEDSNLEPDGTDVLLIVGR